MALTARKTTHGNRSESQQKRVEPATKDFRQKLPAQACVTARRLSLHGVRRFADVVLVGHRIDQRRVDEQRDKSQREDQ